MHSRYRSTCLPCCSSSLLEPIAPISDVFFGGSPLASFFFWLSLLFNCNSLFELIDDRSSQFASYQRHIRQGPTSPDLDFRLKIPQHHRQTFYHRLSIRLPHLQAPVLAVDCVASLGVTSTLYRLIFLSTSPSHVSNLSVRGTSQVPLVDHAHLISSASSTRILSLHLTQGNWLRGGCSFNCAHFVDAGLHSLTPPRASLLARSWWTLA